MATKTQMYRSHDSFLQGIFEGRMLGKRTRGRRQMQMLHDLTGNSDYVTLKQTELYKGRCGDTVEGYPEPVVHQKTEGRKELYSYRADTDTDTDIY